MPYIKEISRRAFDPTIRRREGGLSPREASEPGALNFQITRLCDDYLARRGVNYTEVNTVIGVLECAKLEFYRRIAVPYEDMKQKENGDVYESTKG